jgi:hypothetical protein
LKYDKLVFFTKDGCEDVDWIHLAQERIHWQAFVNMVMTFELLKAGIFLTT